MTELERIALRRQALIERAARERAELVAVCGRLQRPAAIFDRGFALASKVRSHPGIVLGATALLGFVLVKRGIAGKLAGVAVKAVKYAVPVVRFWLERK